MQFRFVEQTYICQLGKPENRTVLHDFVNRRDGSPAELARYYRAIVSMLQGTRAWGVAGVNKMINELTDKVKATYAHAKKGKTTAYAHANQLLYKIDTFADEEAGFHGYHERVKLMPLVSDEVLDAMLESEVAAAAEPVHTKEQERSYSFRDPGSYFSDDYINDRRNNG